MALSNLNNPYSPQPSTPNATGEGIMMDLPQVNIGGKSKSKTIIFVLNERNYIRIILS